MLVSATGIPSCECLQNSYIFVVNSFIIAEQRRDWTSTKAKARMAASGNGRRLSSIHMTDLCPPSCSPVIRRISSTPSIRLQ